MELVHERLGAFETLSFDSKGDISIASGDLTFLDRRRGQTVGDRLAHACNGCWEIRPDVDLWAENSETGEQLWLCEACGEW
jgi:hypothetical protein